LDDATVTLLKAWKVAQQERALAVGGAIRPGCYVLSHDLACLVPWTPQVMTRKWRRLADKAGIGFRLHDLRHAYGTLLLSNGVPVQEVSALMGHSKTSTTMNVYAHVTDRPGPSAAEISRANLNAAEA